MRSPGDHAWTNPPRPAPAQRPPWEAANVWWGTTRRGGSQPRRMGGGRSAAVLVGRTSPRGGRASRGQGEGPEQGGVSDANDPHGNTGAWTCGGRCTATAPASTSHEGAPAALWGPLGVAHASCLVGPGVRPRQNPYRRSNAGGRWRDASAVVRSTWSTPWRRSDRSATRGRVGRCRSDGPRGKRVKPLDASKSAAAACPLVATGWSKRDVGCAWHRSMRRIAAAPRRAAGPTGVRRMRCPLGPPVCTMVQAMAGPLRAIGGPVARQCDPAR